MVSKILCATRGGAASRRTRNAAIELAKERDDKLLFLYVVDLEFLNRMAEAGVSNTEQELTARGRSLLLSARELAAERGVAAEMIIHTEEMRDEVKDVVHKEEVSLVVMGQPAGPKSVFELDDVEAIASEIEDELGIEARII
jgi:nucleotide-binding universal stress UspA family protein